MNTYYTYLDSPLGRLLLVSDGQALTGLYLPVHRHGPQVEADWIEDAKVEPFTEAERQLGDYFAGTRTTFDLPLAAQGTPFQKRVWEALSAIPYGITISYGELAKRIGKPNASRAVGLANGRNPLSIVVPCHRVIGANGALVGYGGSLPVKERLLALEKRQ